MIVNKSQSTMILFHIPNNEQRIRAKALNAFFETNGAILHQLYEEIAHLTNRSLNEWCIFAYQQTSTDGLKCYIN